MGMEVYEGSLLVHVDYNYDAGRDNTHTTLVVSDASDLTGTRTYAVFGYSSGHNSGIDYKATQDDGAACHGPCSYEAADIDNYYWLFDMNDLMAVKQGSLADFYIDTQQQELNIRIDPKSTTIRKTMKAGDHYNLPAL